MNITANVLDTVLPVKETEKTRMSKEHSDRGYRAENRPKPLAVEPKKVGLQYIESRTALSTLNGHNWYILSIGHSVLLP